MDTWLVGRLTLCTDVSPGAWIVSSVWPFHDHVVGSMLPSTFDAYAQLFHPATRHTGDHAAQNVRWSQVAAANGRIAHPAMEWVSITGDWQFENGPGQPGVWDDAPSLGSLPTDQIQRLATVLAAHTSTPAECWFAYWEGMGALAVPDATVARLAMPQRPMILLTGSLNAVTTSVEGDDWSFFNRGPSLWWPDDRSWCVATDVDLMTTYIGGSRACVDSLITDGRLEVMQVTVDQSVTWDRDHLNPPATGRPGWAK